jgi:hypothetical protein
VPNNGRGSGLIGPGLGSEAIGESRAWIRRTIDGGACGRRHFEEEEEGVVVALSSLRPISSEESLDPDSLDRGMSASCRSSLLRALFEVEASQQVCGLRWWLLSACVAAAMRMHEDGVAARLRFSVCGVSVGLPWFVCGLKSEELQWRGPCNDETCLALRMHKDSPGR